MRVAESWEGQSAAIGCGLYLQPAAMRICGVAPKVDEAQKSADSIGATAAGYSLSTLNCRLSARSYTIFDSRSFTRSESALPSTVLPSRRAFAALITPPIAFGEFAPVSAMAASIAAFMSESEAAAGR